MTPARAAYTRRPQCRRECRVFARNFNLSNGADAPTGVMMVNSQKVAAETCTPRSQMASHVGRIGYVLDLSDLYGGGHKWCLAFLQKRKTVGPPVAEPGFALDPVGESPDQGGIDRRVAYSR